MIELMEFYPQQLFHIYNQGNNRRQLFFSDENYQFFLWKMRGYLTPFGDLVAWCLMPNHFHWLFYVRLVEIERKILRQHIDEVEYLRRVKAYGAHARAVDRAYTRKAEGNSVVTLNEAIGTLQNAYSRALNKEKGWTGSLFRERCKAKDGWIDEFVCLEKLDGKADHRFLPNTDYAFQCLCYIHENARVAGLVKENIDWVYSSARDYEGLRKGTLCNLKIGRELIDFL